MAEKDNVNPVAEIEELPDPKISKPQAGQDLAQAGDPSVTLEDFRGMVREEMQSIKDTRLGKHDTRLENLESAIAQYEAEKGGTVDAKALSKLQGVQRDKEILERVVALEGGKVPDASAGAGIQNWKERRASILSEAGIEGSDPRFVEFMKQKFSSYDDMNEQLYKRVEDWSFTDEQKPKPSASTVAQVVPSIPTGGGDYTEDKYAEDMNKARGNKAELERIKAAARADGVDVDNIGFT